MPRSTISITHSLFADDTLLFGFSSLQEARSIKHVLDLYSAVSGQQISIPKSKVYIFFTTKIILDKIANILGFQQQLLPSTYLGIPFFMGSNKAGYWKPIIDRIKSRVSAWKVRWLSLLGKNFTR